MIPIVVLYNTNNLNSLGNDASSKLKILTGRHTCHFHYTEPSKNTKYKRVRIKIDGQEWGIIAEIGKSYLCLNNPWFKPERIMGAVNEKDAITRECNIIFISFRQNPLNFIIENNYHAQLPEIRALLLMCSSLRKPIVPVHKELEKEIWTAYCDGLNALNRERRDFITIDYVGKPILYNDSRQGEIYTMKLGFANDSIDNLKKNLTDMLKDKYQISSIDLNENQDLIQIQFKGTEKVNDEDFEHVSEYLQRFGFSLSKNGISNVLKLSVAFKKTNQRTDLYDQLDSLLQTKGIQFSNNEKLEYSFDDESSVNIFSDCVSEVFGPSSSVKLSNTLIHVSCDDEQLRKLKELLADESQIGYRSRCLRIHPTNKQEYYKLTALIEQVFSEIGYEDYEIPEYQQRYVVDTSNISSDRQAQMKYAAEQLDGMRSIASKYEFDESHAYVIRFEFKFKSAYERESIIHEMSSIVAGLGRAYTLVNKNPIGITQISFERDLVLIQRMEEELKYEFLGEEIKLVDGRTYNELFKDITDTENIIDPVVRERYNRFMAECPTIGTCHKRTNDYIIVNLSEDFYNGESFQNPIRNNDMVFFPSVGTSTELRRQYEAIQRINKPGVKLSNGRKILPPVNPALCDFLFSPLYARDIKASISGMMDVVRSNKLEEHLNDRQVEAVAKAVLAEDISFIQGPPGTGKTTVIAEIIWQEILRNPKCKILLTSQTNLAVDNALERLKYKRAIRPLRVISDMRNNSDDLIYNANILDEWTEQPNERNAENVVNYWIDSIVKRIEEDTDYSEVTKEWHDYLATKSKSVRKVFVDEYKSGVNLIAATCSLCGSQQFIQTFTRMYDTEEVAFDVVIMDEASKATPLEMAIPMVLGKKIIVIGDHKQLPPLLDENSIDTALHKIGRDDLAEKIQDLKESQFKKLFQMAQKFKPNLVTTLNTQYRMHNDIMKTINQFYVDELGETGLVCGIKNVQDTPNYSVRGSRWHGITMEPFINPSTHAIWVNVEGREEKEYTSYKNMDEVKAVKTVIKALSIAPGFSDYIAAQGRIEDQEIGLITFYSAQRKELKRLEQSGELDPGYDYRIDVVDRFQGMERNIVIVSTVRSNKYNGIGFAKEIERINVAFSRARSLLIVIGNRDLFSTKYNYKQSIASMESIDIKQIEDLIKYGEDD